MIAVDHHPRPFGPGKRRQLGNPVEHPAAVEQHLADQDQVDARRSCAASRKRSEKSSNGSAATLVSSTSPASAQRAICRRAEWNSPSLVSTRSAPPPRRGQAAASRMRKSCVLDAKTIADGSPLPSSAATWRLRFGPDLAHHLVPLMVGQARGVFPAFDLAVEDGVGPQMMAVRGEMQPARRGAEALGEQRLEAQCPAFTGRPERP